MTVPLPQQPNHERRDISFNNWMKRLARERQQELDAYAVRCRGRHPWDEGCWPPDLTITVEQIALEKIRQASTTPMSITRTGPETWELREYFP